MANIYINKDAIYFTAPASITSDYYKTTTQGYATSNYKTVWAGVNLGYTDGYILPTSGTLTFIGMSKLDGTSLYSADNFSYNLSTLPVLWSVGDFIFKKIASVQPNNIIGSASNDIIPAYYPGDNIKGGLGKDTILLNGPSTAYSVTVTSPSSSSGKVTVLSNGNSFFFESMELITFTDKTVDISDYIVYAPTQKTSSLSIIVDKGIIDVNAVLLSNLVETMTYSGSILISHTVKYGNAVFNFNDIDPLVTTVVRDGNFTVEFQKEIANLAPSAANITYSDVVSLIGVANVVNVLIHIAGADGNFVS